MSKAVETCLASVKQCVQTPVPKLHAVVVKIYGQNKYSNQKIVKEEKEISAEVMCTVHTRAELRWTRC
jgi:hypothetical protein